MSGGGCGIAWPGVNRDRLSESDRLSECALKSPYVSPVCGKNEISENCHNSLTVQDSLMKLHK